MISVFMNGREWEEEGREREYGGERNVWKMICVIVFVDEMKE